MGGAAAHSLERPDTVGNDADAGTLPADAATRVAAAAAVSADGANAADSATEAVEILCELPLSLPRRLRLVIESYHLAVGEQRPVTHAR